MIIRLFGLIHSEEEEHDVLAIEIIGRAFLWHQVLEFSFMKFFIEFFIH